MALINLGKIDKNLIPILIGCIFCFLSRISNNYDGTLLMKNAILTNIVISISKLFTIIPLLIFKIRSKRKESIEIENLEENKFDYIYNDIHIDDIQGKGKFIILSAFIFFIQSIIFVISFQIKTNAWILEILITSIFYYLIFKKKLYKHHYLSIILIILIGLIIDLVLGNLQKDITEHYLLLLMRFLREILYSFHDVVDKYIMEKKYGSIYEIAFYTGLINIILLGILSILDYYYFGLDNLPNYFNNFDRIELLVIFVTMITQLGLYLCLVMTNKNYTPCHLFMIFVFGQLAYYIDFSGTSIIIIICLIFILFFSLIFNEIIEINFWGLSDNTKKNIRKRAETESGDNLFIMHDDTIDSISEKNENMIELN